MGAMEMQPLYLGIDLGTTNSAVAAFDGKETCAHSQPAGALTPSVVRIDARTAM
jgi:molecular chaperone DnaK